MGEVAVVIVAPIHDETCHQFGARDDAAAGKGLSGE
jgi:hypothetical protein